MSLVSERFPCLYLKLLKFQPIEANLLIFGSHERKLMSLIFRMIHHWSFWAPLGWQRWNYSPYLYHIVGAGSIFAQLSVGLRGFLFANAQSSGKVGIFHLPSSCLRSNDDRVGWVEPITLLIGLSLGELGFSWNVAGRLACYFWNCFFH